MHDHNPLKAVFFDRDGVLNVDRGYVHDPADLEWVPGAREAIAALTAAGVRSIVVTNQSGVARGYYGEDAVLALHAHMQGDLQRLGGQVSAFYHCPFHKDAVVEAYRCDDHPDRKPNPGMILRGLAEAGLSPEECVLVGDNDSDVEAARRAGVEGFLFTGGDLLHFLRTKLGRRFPAGPGGPA
ncbi:D-glycero-alpha-D-manno-heptose-1,7-bisphosphate 7-phosphatase [Caulobacter radicis]|jgi:D-glycero-D-manno-heptose 1,7-bisphosphate phosphatase|uniref:D,D-heptose 1,7-bisphosphate phosphatase n=1 Tax=Caulobacter radicis TaxID=2172650 RepID=A0A2T9J1P5_9CAUL|nr:HAD family hydrolase [Caulobacter radicis]PVM74006.1 D,D-heptose 1,7-bisphosphate phosphatase [Caulobacter radicis]